MKLLTPNEEAPLLMASMTPPRVEGSNEGDSKTEILGFTAFDECSTLRRPEINRVC